jgi:integrase/recombinase XerD
MSKQAQTLSKSELNKVLTIIEAGRNGLRNKTIILLTHYLALRAKEIASIKINDVLDANGNIKTVLQLKASYTKGDKHRDIPLSNIKVKNTLTEWVQYRQEHDYKFVTDAPLFKSQKNKAFSNISMARMISQLYKDAGKPECSSHTGRRSMITKLANAGTDLNSIRVLAGHESVQTTQRYIDTNPDMLADIMKNI